MPYYQINFTTGEPELDKSFYRLGLHDKYTIIEELQTLGLITDALLISLANAVLQHSTDKAKRDWPCRSIRRLPKEAKLADIRYKLQQHSDLAGLSTMNE